jgi:hypothetical protein
LNRCGEGHAVALGEGIGEVRTGERDPEPEPEAIPVVTGERVGEGEMLSSSELESVLLLSLWSSSDEEDEST